MGCYPLKELISRALGKCNGKEERRTSNRMVYSPPSPVCTHRRATVVKSVNFSNNNPVYIIPPEPDPGTALPNRYPEPVVLPSHLGPSSSKGHEEPQPEPKPKRKSKGSKKARFAPGPIPQDHVRPVQSEPGPDYRNETEPRYHDPVHHEPGQYYQGPVHREPDPVYRGSVPYYVPSPLPRWEYGQRRQEYFSGEYSYYPTPIREGIYSIAADPHRLTTIFSEENPNACSIS